MNRELLNIVPTGTVLPFEGREKDLWSGWLRLNGEEIYMSKLYPSLFERLCEPEIRKVWETMGGEIDEEGGMVKLPNPTEDEARILLFGVAVADDTDFFLAIKAARS